LFARETFFQIKTEITMTAKLLRLGTAVLFLTSVSWVRAAIAPAENLLPADTLAFFTVPDTAVLRTAWKASPQVMFWFDDGMRAFRERFMAKFNEKFIAPMEADLGIKVADFLALPQGQFTLAVTVNGSNGHDDIPPGLLLLLDAKDNSDLLKTNLATLTKKWTDAGRALRTEKIHGLAFTVVQLNSNDFAGIFPKRTPVSEIGQDPKPEQPGEIYFTQYQSLLVAGNSSKVVEAVAAHLTGGSQPAIADEATFADDKISQFRDQPTYYGWFNAAKAIGLMTPSADAGGDDSTAAALAGLSAAKILGATGLGGLRSASFAMHDAPVGSSLTLHITAPESTRTGLLKILALPQKDAAIPAFVPADATKFSRFRLDGRQTWAELQKMVAGISPQYLAYLNSAVDMINTLAQAKDPGFDLRNNLFGNLGDDVIIYGKSPTGDTLADYASPPAIYLVAVSNPDLVINSIKNIAALTSPQDAAPAPREFLGHKVYSISLRAKAAAGADAPVPNYLYVSSSSRYLALSQNTTILEEFLRNPEAAKPLGETPGLADAADHVGGMGGGLFTYENQRETMRAAFKLLKNTEASDTALAMFPAAFRDWVDFSQLPAYETAAKYFYLSVMGGSADANGITLQVYAPRPPQLK
jgi:hypothetical protein